MNQKMEVEFDKEIDALLRKAGKSGEATAPVFDSHLDADEISMFAENATPESARTRTIAHLADCDRCRTVFSNVIALNAESPVIEQSAVPVPSEIGTETPGWLSRLFSTRNLAFGFGALALIFVGVIGFGVIRNMNSGETQLAQADKSVNREAAAKAPEPSTNANTTNSAATESDLGNANSETSANEPSADGEAPLSIGKNEAATGKDVARRQESDDDGFSGNRGDVGRFRDSKEGVAVDAVREETSDKPVFAERRAENAAAPPPPAPATEASKPVLTTRGAVEKKKEDENAKLAAADSSVAAGRSVGAKRQIGGKTFDRRNGVWYDSEYRNQPVTSIKRGTSKYSALDAGLRSIAEELTGTVVVVWKTKAYKIQ